MSETLLEQLAYEAYERTRWPGRTRVPWDHAALSVSRPAWEAAIDAATRPLREQLAIATGALRDIGLSDDAFAREQASRALDDIGGVKPCAPGEVERLREQLELTREQLRNLAAGLELSASASAPSKKSEIERSCAAAVRGIAGPPS